jgi:hypothetical protein
MKYILLSLLCILSLSWSHAQVDHGGTPLSWTLEVQTDIPVVRMPLVDVKALKLEDQVTDQYKETPYRFGKDHEADINFFSEATSVNYKNTSIYQMTLWCPEAVSVSFLFDEFYIPEEASLFVYSEDKAELKGAFTHENNKASGIFPVGLVKGERVILEYNGPAEGAVLHISQVSHGYRAILNKWEAERGPFGNSGACNINVNCPEGADWEAQKRSVALIVQGSFAQCSGAMVNNTLQDETPYFLTANHCLGNPANWIYYFNHESASCSGSTGPTSQSISGGTLLANNSGSDFALIELSANIPSAFNVYFSGWDNTDATTVTSAVGIHHPSGDVKKICFENNSPFHNTAAGAQVWYINQWEDGVTEGGSSGSPLYDQNGRIIGQLYGGAAACAGTVNNGQYDYYGRFGVSWDGANASSRLRDWLDPGNTGVSTVDGYGPNDVEYALDAASNGVTGIPDVVCNTDPFTPSFTLRNNGTTVLTSATIQSTYNGTAQSDINWSGSLSQGQSEAVQLSTFFPNSGSNSITVTISSANGVVDENPANNVASTNLTIESGAAGLGDLTITILTDDYAEETSWELKDASGNILADGGAGYQDNTTYEVTVPLPNDGCYEFVINDAFGDGICCGFGEGYYTLTDGQGNELASGGEFDSSESTILSMSSTTGLGANELAAALEIFPNPTDGILNIQIESSLDQFDLRVMNPVGQIVRTENIRGRSFTSMDLSSLPAGTYFLELSSNGSRTFKRFVLNR